MEERLLNEQRVYESAARIALNAPLPARTATYSPVSHAEIIEAIQRNLASNNLVVAGRRMYINGSGSKVVGFYDVEDNTDFGVQPHGLKMMLGWRNSYDKSMSIAFAAGGSVWICGNGCISGDLLAYKRKHTGDVGNEMNDKIQIGIGRMRDDFGKLNLEIDVMKNYSLTQRQKSELLGVMYFEQDMVSPQQLSIVKRELTESKHFLDSTLWDLYNNVTEALKTSHPTSIIDDHIRLHRFASEVAGIITTTQVAEEGEAEADGSTP